MYLVIFLDYFEVVFEPVLSQFPPFQEDFQLDFVLSRTFLVDQNHYCSLDMHKLVLCIHWEPLDLINVGSKLT